MDIILSDSNRAKKHKVTHKFESALPVMSLLVPISEDDGLVALRTSLKSAELQQYDQQMIGWISASHPNVRLKFTQSFIGLGLQPRRMQRVVFSMEYSSDSPQEMRSGSKRLGRPISVRIPTGVLSWKHPVIYFILGDTPDGSYTLPRMSWFPSSASWLATSVLNKWDSHLMLTRRLVTNCVQ